MTFHPADLCTLCEPANALQPGQTPSAVSGLTVAPQNLVLKRNITRRKQKIHTASLFVLGKFSPSAMLFGRRNFPARRLGHMKNDPLQPIDYRCDYIKKVGEFRGDIGAIK